MINAKNMGVINITPNSFSDGGKFNSLETFSKKFTELVSWAEIIDIGAESSAPFNKAITEAEELARYESIFYKFMDQCSDPAITLSIDTYKIEVFKKVAKKVSIKWPKTKLIFNDVSGKIDEELLELFKDKTMPEFSYVFSHNLAPTRLQTLEHMSYCLENMGHDNFIEKLIIYFEEGRKKIPQKVNVFFDPCFGFSKTREQNQYLLKNFSRVCSHFSSDQVYVYGISKKSFLRFPEKLDIKNGANLDILNHMQTLFFYELLQSSISSAQLIFRVHDKTSLLAIKNCKIIFDL